MQAGRILGERTLVIQDETGGIPVRLPDAGLGSSFPRGAIVEAHGQLAAPYGNLELRVSAQADMRTLGSAGLPEPRPLTALSVAEEHEGSLATLSGTLVDIDRYDSGAVSLAVKDDKGEARVYAFAPLALDRDAFSKGQRVRATGIVGQRASSSGGSDGHRLWLRGQGDLVVLAEPPSATPPASGEPGEPPTQRPPRVRIRDATPGRTVTIVGVVTSKAGFIDSEGRRVTVADRTGAILVRYPADTRPAGVGRVVRATGEVGTWFGTTQLEAAAKPRRKGRASVKPTILREAPEGSSEWQLVRVTVRITHIERSGDTWRAEAVLGNGETLPIVGLAGAGVAGDLLEPGRAARVTGIVRRAHPSATDQRFAVAPRSIRDIRLGDLRTDDDDDGDGDDDDERDSALAVVAGDSDVLSATFGSLADLDDRLVRVGGRVEVVAERRLILDDGTAQGVVRLDDTATAFEPALRVGQVVNATGRVRHRDGRPEVLVAAASDVRRAATLVSAERPASPTFAPAWARRSDAASTDAAFGPTPTSSGAMDRLVPLLVLAALGAIAFVLLTSAAVWAWRAQATAPTADDVSRDR